MHGGGCQVSGSLGGALAGSSLAFLIADRVGRRGELLVASVLYLLGAAAMGGAPSLPVLLAGRLVYGVGIGLVGGGEGDSGLADWQIRLHKLWT